MHDDAVKFWVLNTFIVQIWQLSLSLSALKRQFNVFFYIQPAALGLPLSALIDRLDLGHNSCTFPFHLDSSSHSMSERSVDDLKDLSNFICYQRLEE